MHSFNYLANWLSKCCVAFVFALALTACGYSLRGSDGNMTGAIPTKNTINATTGRQYSSDG